MLQCGPYVFKHGHVRENCRYLERSDNTAACGLRRFLVGDVCAVKGDAAIRGRQKLRQQVEKRGFASAVGTDQCMNMSALNFQIHIVDGDESFELFTQAARFQNELN